MHHRQHIDIHERQEVTVRILESVAFWNTRDTAGASFRFGSQSEEWLWDHLRPVTVKEWSNYSHNLPETRKVYSRWIPMAGTREPPFDGSILGFNFDIKAIKSNRAAPLEGEIVIRCTERQAAELDVFLVMWIKHTFNRNAPNTNTVKLLKCIKV